MATAILSSPRCSHLDIIVPSLGAQVSAGIDGLTFQYPRLMIKKIARLLSPQYSRLSSTNFAVTAINTDQSLLEIRF